jgi:hypothetical protein
MFREMALLPTQAIGCQYTEAFVIIFMLRLVVMVGTEPGAFCMLGAIWILNSFLLNYV